MGKLSTDKASCLNRNCHYYRECPFFVARREIQEAEVVVANHALVMAAMESEAVLPEPKNLLLVLDEGHHLPDVARDALEMSAEITAPWFRLQLDLFCKLVATCMEQFRPKTTPPLANPERLTAHCEELFELIASLNNILNLYMPMRSGSGASLPDGRTAAGGDGDLPAAGEAHRVAARPGGAVPERSQRKDLRAMTWCACIGCCCR